MRVVSIPLSILIFAFAMSAEALAQAGAQGYPNKVIRIIVPSPAGGPTDVGARVIGQKMSDNWGQSVVVDNRPGGNNIIGMQAAAKAAPDGYTLVMAIDSSMTMHPALYAKLPYDPLRDFAPVTHMFISPVIMITDATLGPKSLKDLIQQARANPGKLSFGAGTMTTRLAGELFKSLAGVDLVAVPYKGSAGTTQGLLSNDVIFTLDGVPTSMPHIRSGKFRVLASMTQRPIPALPNVPFLSGEPGMAGFDVSVWLGLLAPAGTHPDIIDKLHHEMLRILGLQDVKDKIGSIGLEPGGAGPAEFASLIRAESARWAKVIKDSGFRGE